MPTLPRRALYAVIVVALLIVMPFVYDPTGYRRAAFLGATRNEGKDMSNKRFKRVTMPASELQGMRSALPVNPVFLQALQAYHDARGEGYEVRTVPARQISTPPETPPTQEGLAVMYHGFDDLRMEHERPDAIPITVLERPGGILQAWDDVHLIATYRDLAPDAMLRVVIIGTDPDPVASA